MTGKKTLVITSIAGADHPVLKLYANECKKRKMEFVMIGDVKSPEEFQLDGCDFWSVKKQLTLDFSLAPITPVKHYSRKNLGYLVAIKNGCDQIIETDDDNIPEEAFWADRQKETKAFYFENRKWVNVYSYYSDQKIWPRGFPLEELSSVQPELKSCPEQNTLCPIQQGLANDNPDVDAVYRLTYPLPITFKNNLNLALGRNSWSPFNTQNTFWFEEAFPLLYLPSYCSFRMTDIWRSYVAQRIAWECGWSILYHEADVWQERNDHNLMKDFEDEIPGYMNNDRICKALESLTLKPGVAAIFENLVSCYKKLIEIGVVDKEEMTLLNAWIADFRKLTS